MATRYRIGEFAELSGVSAKTLRFYDEIGLLRPAAIDARTRYRFYQPEQMAELARILSFKEAGVPLADVRKMMEQTGSPRERRDALVKLKERVEESIETARRSLDWINAAIEQADRCENPVPVVMKRRPSALIASIRSEVRTYAHIEAFERELLAEVPVHSRGVLRGVLWHRCADSGSLEGEAFLTLKDRIPKRSTYEVKQLPSATLACAYSTPDHDSAENAYEAIRNWMNVRGYRLFGPKREIYHDQMLEIQFPLTR